MQRTIHHEDSEALKNKVALEAIQGHQTVAELATNQEVHPTQIAAMHEHTKRCSVRTSEIDVQLLGRRYKNSDRPS